MKLKYKGTVDFFMMGADGIIHSRHENVDYATHVVGTYAADKPLVQEVLERAIWRMVLTSKPRKQAQLFYSLDTNIVINFELRIIKGSNERMRMDGVEKPMLRSKFLLDIQSKINELCRHNVSQRIAMICHELEHHKSRITSYLHYYKLLATFTGYSIQDWEALGYTEKRTNELFYQRYGQTYESLNRQMIRYENTIRNRKRAQP